MSPSLKHTLEEHTPESEGSSKRRPKSSYACDACRRRRSKCDLVDSKGCHRCKQVGTACSLEGSEILKDLVSPPVLSDELQEVRDRLSQLERLLHRSRDLSVMGQEGNLGAGLSGREEAWYLDSAGPETYGMVHRGLESKADRGLRDPVREGVISEQEAETLYQLFRVQCARIFPHPLFLGRSSLPSHPFLRSTCLLYANRAGHGVVSSSHSQQLESVVVDNLMAYHRGCRPSMESMMSGLLLSYLPFGEADSGQIADLDPPRMVGMAYGQMRELGHSVFFARLVDSLENGEDPATLKSAIEEARLHMCVLTRCTWTNICRAPCHDPPLMLRPMHSRFLELLFAKGVTCPLDQHLLVEIAALDILVQGLTAWLVIEQVKTPSTQELQQGNMLTRLNYAALDAVLTAHTFEGRVSPHLGSMPYLRCLVTYYKWWACARNVWYATRIPTPSLLPDAYDEWMDGLALVAEASRQMVVQCLEEQWQLDVYPRAIANALVLCVLALSNGISHRQYHFPNHPLPNTLDVGQPLKDIKKVLRDLNPTVAAMLARAEATQGEYDRTQSNPDSANGSSAELDPNGTFGANELSAFFDHIQPSNPLSGLQFFWDQELLGNGYSGF